MRHRVVLALAGVVAFATPVSAHVMVVPATSIAGAVERYTVIVPTEGRSPTVRVEVRMPLGFDVVAIESKPGWNGSNRPLPIGAATVGWADGRIPPGEMMTFDILVVNGKAARTITWSATQWYEDGSSDRWGDGAPANHEASRTTLTPPKPGAAAADDRSAKGARGSGAGARGEHTIGPTPRR